MQRRNFMKLAGLLASIPALKGMAATQVDTSSKNKDIYEWRIYTLTGEGSSLDDFFKDTLIPAYNRKGIKVGAFTPFKEAEKGRQLYLFVYPDIATYYMVKHEIWNDPIFSKAARPFYEATAPNPVYSNFEAYLCEAFNKIPTLRMPDKARTLFELRTYHSPNEEANQRKVDMFNKDELAIFDQAGINPVCYGEILAGSRMPALMYLTWYKDEPTHDKAWKKFVNHPDWKRIKDLPEYAYTATNNTSLYLAPLPYSQI